MVPSIAMAIVNKSIRRGFSRNRNAKKTKTITGDRYCKIVAVAALATATALK